MINSIDLPRKKLHLRAKTPPGTQQLLQRRVDFNGADSCVSLLIRRIGESAIKSDSLNVASVCTTAENYTAFAALADRERASAKRRKRKNTMK